MADPVHDVSLELEGPVAIDAHFYANRQWNYIRRKQSTCWGKFVDEHVPDAWEVPRQARVTVSEFPFGIDEFPPSFDTSVHHPISQCRPENDIKKEQPRNCIDNDHDKGSTTTSVSSKSNPSIPLLSIGRYGAIVKRDRPADDALIAMFNAAQSSIRLVIQDLGPMQLPGTKRPLPGTQWPRQYLNALARAIWKRQVTVEIIVSNPNSMPGHLRGPGEFVYGNGWTCVDVAVEILQAIRSQFRFHVLQSETIQKLIHQKLKISYLRLNGDTRYECGTTIGLHGKFSRM